MSSQRVRDFEFKLGKLGLTLFVFGISLLVLVSFIGGVFVGKNIESYPEKIAHGPYTIKQKVVNSISGVGNSPANGESSGEDTKGSKKEVELTFFDTLTQKNKYSPEDNFTRQTEKQNISTSKARYVVQVASLKDREMTEILRSKLKKMNYTAIVEQVVLPSGRKWFRVRLDGYGSMSEAKRASTAVEKKIRGIKCLIVKKK